MEIVMKHIFIVNPTSGNGDYKRVVTWLNDNLDHSTYEVHYTEYEGHATEIAQRYKEGVYLYSVGGDGTAFEVLNGLNLEVPLSLIPAGTGNDFFKMFKFEGSLEELVKHSIEYQNINHVDFGEVNGKRFMNCSNIGVDAEVNAYANTIRPKHISRKFVYAYSALVKIFTMKPTLLNIIADGEVVQKNITLFSIMNGRWYGNGFKSAPNALADDGYFDVCMVDSVSIPRALYLVAKYFKGTHLGYKEVDMRHLKTLTISSNKPITYGCDGEIFVGDTLHYQIHEKALKLRGPKLIYEE